MGKGTPEVIFAHRSYSTTHAFLSDSDLNIVIRRYMINKSNETEGACQRAAEK